MQGLLADLRHALRLYAKTPVGSAVAVGVLATAMAVVTALLSLWNDIALRPPAGFEQGGELLTVGQNDGRRFFPLPLEILERIDGEATTIAAMAGMSARQLELVREGEREPVNVELVTQPFFAEMRPRMRIGRPLEPADHDANAAPVAVLSYAFWQSEYAGRPDVLGETITLAGRNPSQPPGEAASRSQEYRIVGVLAPELRGTFSEDTSVWLPHEQVWPFLTGGGGSGGFTALRGLARLAPGASVRAARNELEGRFGDALDALGDGLPGARLDAVPGIVQNVNAYRDTLRQVHLFLAGSVLLALVAACNVSLFLLSRAPGRRRELAIRQAVGAPLKRLARQLATESSLLVAAATLLGVLASPWISAAIRELAFLRVARWRDVTVLDWRVLAVTGGLTLLIAMLASLAPVAGLGRIGISAGSRRVTARPGRAQRLAGTVQVTVAAVIAATAIAFFWQLRTLAAVDRGFSAPDVHVLRLEPPERPPGVVAQEADMRRREHRREVIAGLPGVESVAFGTAVPGAMGLTMILRAAPPEDPDAAFGFDQFGVDRAYFDLLGVSLLDGRLPEAGERDAVVVNATLARRLWGRIDVASELLPLSVPADGKVPRPEVVGVVKDIVFGNPSDDVPPTAFRISTGLTGFELILIKSTRTSAELRDLLQQKIDANELELTIASIEPIERAWARTLAPDRARTTLTFACAVLVVVLAGFGYFGTQRFVVAAGRREFAILAAVGAGPRALGRLVLGRGLMQGLPGLGLGALLAFVLLAWMRGDYFSSAVSPGVVALLVAGGTAVLLLAATYGPARQARSTSPAPLLKEE